jgi:hypothetical protein
MSQYIFDVINAFDNIPIEYFNVDVHHIAEYYSKKQKIERVFMSELYHQWRKIMENKPLVYSGLILHTEIGKIITKNVEFPDISLHGGQFGKNRMRNELMIELKMDDYDSNDFTKLRSALGNPLQYKSVLYLIVNSNKETIKNKIRQESDRYINYALEKFYFFTKKDRLFQLKID